MPSKTNVILLNTLMQEEKDFLVYMYGADLPFIIPQKPKETQWWIEAFQAVKKGKRPKFNWVAFFLASIWALRKKALKLAMINSLCFWFSFIILTPIVFPAICPTYICELLLVIFIVFNYVFANIISGFYGPSMIIKSYLKSNIKVKNGQLPLGYVIGYCAFYVPILINLLQPIYALILMKFWLPVKKEKNV